jgi:hydrogenase/urease accessory protein HupE
MRLLAAALLFSAAASAHQNTVSYSELEVRGRAVEGTLRFSLADLRTQIQLEPPRLPLPALAKLVLQPFTLRAGGKLCALQPLAAEMEGGDGVLLRASWLCDEPVEELVVRVGFLESFPIGHVHLSRIAFGPREISQRAAQAGEPSFEVRRSRSVAAEAWRFLLLGIGHIFTGYDHIAFLIGLLLLGGTLLELVKIVTAFTVAHSFTLALAALDVFAPSPRLVEPLIAASIVYVGVENLWALRTSRAASALRHRWMITFAFGLVHGFGFASVLRELELPRAVLATGLVSFNLGVEVGQVAIVLLAVPLLRRLRKLPAFSPALSACVSVLGAFWLVQRVLP